MKVYEAIDFDFIIENYRKILTNFGLENFDDIDRDLADIKRHLVDCVMSKYIVMNHFSIICIFLTLQEKLEQESSSADTSSNVPISIKNLTEVLPLKVDWLKVLRSLVDFEVDEDFQIYLLRTVKSMLKLFESMDNRLFANIFHTRFLLEFYQLHTLYFVTVFENELWGIEKAQQRYEQCVRIVRTQMPVAFTSLLVDRFTNKRMIEDAYELANRTMEIIINDVEKDDSMPFGNKRHMLHKLRSLKLILGYPEELLDVQNVEDVYKDLNLTGSESFLKLFIETFTFSKNQGLRYFVKSNSNGFERNETTRWIDYTTEDEYVTPLYELDIINTICEERLGFALLFKFMTP